MLVETLKRRDDVSVARALEFFDARRTVSDLTPKTAARMTRLRRRRRRDERWQRGTATATKETFCRADRGWHPIRLGFDYNQPVSSSPLWMPRRAWNRTRSWTATKARAWTWVMATVKDAAALEALEMRKAPPRSLTSDCAT